MNRIFLGGHCNFYYVGLRFFPVPKKSKSLTKAMKIGGFLVPTILLPMIILNAKAKNC